MNEVPPDVKCREVLQSSVQRYDEGTRKLMTFLTRWLRTLKFVENQHLRLGVSCSNVRQSDAGEHFDHYSFDYGTDIRDRSLGLRPSLAWPPSVLLADRCGQRRPCG